MCFENMYESAKRNELLCIDGGVVHFHLRKNCQLTIREIIATRSGAGTEMLDRLKQIVGATSILAKCPADLTSNSWYAKKGFVLESVEYAKSGRVINVWRLVLQR